eukprot:CAMPEP_0201698268 /NCGR_PEP_ID=MMETSP0578-20130828/18095_1 /ASSEMBLY_ACC=CAM_ASM_000663 /TAXON_ID=267565 /ORGANISM="Skeletonema grethea, Strain CCMP 1804" /LENGTH=220 /DNA_ID=CAMNT_0048184749 /DNA_START=40 /DNA_END=702 /DNA_ORIENTATION=+
MVFSCDGTIFTDLELNYGTNDALFIEITAVSEWSNTTKAKVTAKYAGKTVLREKVALCDYLASDSVDCGDAGTVIADVSPLVAARLGDQFLTSTMDALINAASIEFKANPYGSKKYEEKCTKSTFSSAHLATHNATYGGSSSSKTKNGILIGLAALVGLAALAAYAMKRAKISVGFVRVKRLTRSSSKKSIQLARSTSSKSGAEEKLYEGETTTPSMYTC